MLVVLVAVQLDSLHDFVEMSSVVAAVGVVDRDVVVAVVGLVAAAGDVAEFVGDCKMPLKSLSEVFEL